ncbi:MAG: rRNA maturation RNase YbeY [Chloroflexota bacterium]|nr:rRNA maturation RNase YbeY [Chloroflexota bacterium]
MIDIQNKTQPVQEFNREMIKFAIATALAKFDKQDVDLTLLLTNNAELLRLNRVFRGIDDSTDVLSFNQDFLNPETGRFYLGDIIISFDRAVQQAGVNNHLIDEECAFLAIHGTLHLLGFVHDNPESKTEMWRIQDAVFAIVKKNFKEKR